VINLVVATRNPHKIQEIQEILGPGFDCIPLNQFRGAPRLIEDGDTFATNATRKAVQLARWLAAERKQESEIYGPDPLVLADDSGLEVDVLQGAPGVHSARFAALDGGASGNSSDAENNAKLLRLLKDVPDAKRSARFHCVLALTHVPAASTEPASPVCFDDEVELRTELFEGVCEGRVTLEPRGTGGFGYDPLFIPTGCEHSFAELGEEVKNRLSHRARALARLRERLRSSR